MTSPVTIKANRRTDMGKGASRRLRRSDLLPGIVYGGNEPPVSITLTHNQIWNHAAKDWFYSHILDLKIDDKTEKVVLKDMQRHPYKALITHLDFLRVRADEKFRTNVQIRLINEEECVGVKDGGILMTELLEVEVICLPKDMPEAIEVDVEALNIGDSIYLEDLKLPEEIELPDLQRGLNPLLVTVTRPRAVEEESDDEEELDEEVEGVEEAEEESEE
jgi:large subunit ribosomal protein L25